jgi:hypothetical protein
MVSNEQEAVIKILQKGEVILDSVSGEFNNSIGLLVSTTQRVIFIDKKPLWGMKVTDYFNKNITAITYETNFLTGSIKISADNDNAVINFVPKKRLVSFCENLKTFLFGRI